MHLRSLRKTLNPSRNCARNSAVHTAGLLIRIYLTKKRRHSLGQNKHKAWLTTTRQVPFQKAFILGSSPEVVEDYLDPRQLFWVVTEEEEAIVYILVVAQHFHDCFHNDFNNIGLLDQLSSLSIKITCKKSTKSEMVISFFCHHYAEVTIHFSKVNTELITYQRWHSEYLNGESGYGYTPLMVIINEVLLQLLKVLQWKY